MTEPTAPATTDRLASRASKSAGRTYSVPQVAQRYAVDRHTVPDWIRRWFARSDQRCGRREPTSRPMANHGQSGRVRATALFESAGAAGSTAAAAAAKDMERVCVTCTSLGVTDGPPRIQGVPNDYSDAIDFGRQRSADGALIRREFAAAAIDCREGSIECHYRKDYRHSRTRCCLVAGCRPRQADE